MTEKLKKLPEKYTIVSNGVLVDSELSLKAKGLYAYLLSKPDDWVFHLNVMKRELKESRDAIYSGLKELIQRNYLKRYQVNDGTFGGTIYEFVENPCTEKPYTENPYTEKPYTENPHTTNKDKTKKDKTKTNLDLSFLEGSVMKEAFESYLAFRKEIKKPYKSQKAVVAAFEKLQRLSGGSLEVAEKIVGQSLENQWQGLFPLKTENRNKQPKSMAELYAEATNW